MIAAETAASKESESALRRRRHTIVKGDDINDACQRVKDNAFHLSAFPGSPIPATTDH